MHTSVAHVEVSGGLLLFVSVQSFFYIRIYFIRISRLKFAKF